MTRTVERRIEPRHQLRHGADVRFAGRSTCRGRIVNLSLNGVALSRGGLPTGIMVGETFSLGFRALDGDYSLRLKGRVVHVEQGVIGAELLALSEEDRQGLATQVRFLHKKLSQRNKAEAALRLKTEPLRRRLRQAALTEGRLMALIDHLLEGLEAHLVDAAAAATNDAQSQLLIDEAALLRKAYQEQALGHELCAELLRPLQGQPRLEEGKPGGVVSVMDDRQADLWLAREHLIQSLAGRHGGAMAELERRFSDTVTPGAPASFADALLTGLLESGISSDAVALCLRCSADLIADELEDFYAALLNVR